MFLDGVPTDDGTLFASWVTLAGLTGLVDSVITGDKWNTINILGDISWVTAGDESDDGTLFAYWVTLAGLTGLVDSVTAGDESDGWNTINILGDISWVDRTCRQCHNRR